MTARESITFDRLVILHNPRSSNADKAERLIGTLREKYPEKVVVKTIGESETDNINLLKKNLRPGDILVPFGGDGTICSVVNQLFDPSVPAVLHRTPILPVGTGRMNDVARMLNGKHADDPLYVLDHGRKQPVYPFECTCAPLEENAKPITKTVIYSIGFGYSGASSEALNDPEFRAKIQDQTSVSRTVEFFKAGARLLKNAEYFDITHNGERRAVLEVMAANGHILGGYYRLPTRLSQRELYLTISDDKRFLNTVRTIAELVTNRFTGGQATTSASFILHDQVTAQLGGETFLAPAPCKVTITLREEPVTMIATNPKV